MKVDHPLCVKCHNLLELCKANYPWSEEHWICVECDSTYNDNEIRELYKEIKKGKLGKKKDKK